MNVLLLVIDSLRACSLEEGAEERPRTPFLDELGQKTQHFSRAYATECWTLPSHLSLFTGLLPSEHGAHCQSMAYRGSQPTVAEILSERGFHTEILTRNPIFDGSIPGVTRGFARRTRVLAPFPRWDPAALLLALSKPRLRRQIRETGFFHPSQVGNVRFWWEFARCMFPADARLLAHALERMGELRRAGRPFFLFCNLFDVHAPYAPEEDSILRQMGSLGDVLENGAALQALGLVGRHHYLREGFHLPERGRRALLRRYHRAIELMDRKLERFFEEARTAGLLEETLVVLTSDHGEAFGEHGLYFHDASVYEANLRVPLWIHHPELPPASSDDVVSTRSLFPLMLRAATRSGLEGTLLDPSFRGASPVAVAEHFFTPRVAPMRPCFRQNLAAAIRGARKVIVRGPRVEHYDLASDPGEDSPELAPLGAFGVTSAVEGLTRAQGPAIAHLRRFQEAFSIAGSPGAS